MADFTLEVIWPLNRRHYLSMSAESVVPATRRRRSGSLPDSHTVFEVLTRELMTFHDIAHRLGANADAERGAISRALRMLLAVGRIERAEMTGETSGHRRWGYRRVNNPCD